jgi:hypothetical protein
MEKGPARKAASTPLYLLKREAALSYCDCIAFAIATQMMFVGSLELAGESLVSKI